MCIKRESRSHQIVRNSLSYLLARVDSQMTLDPGKNINKRAQNMDGVVIALDLGSVQTKSLSMKRIQLLLNFLLAWVRSVATRSTPIDNLALQPFKPSVLVCASAFFHKSQGSGKFNLLLTFHLFKRFPHRCMHGILSTQCEMTIWKQFHLSSLSKISAMNDKNSQFSCMYLNRSNTCPYSKRALHAT